MFFIKLFQCRIIESKKNPGIELFLIPGLLHFIEYVGYYYGVIFSVTLI